MKKTLLSLLAVAISTSAFAQSGTNSPYSMYGLGVLSDQSIGSSRGMNGVGIALRERNHVNYLNPASYSNMDSLTFVFDVAASLQLTNFSENGIRKNARNADFEYAVAGFRAARHLGVAFGIIPYTNVGYSFTKSSEVGGTYTQYPFDASTQTFTQTFSGDGGLHEGFLGVGWEPLRGFSIGVNAGYMWGNITRSMLGSFSDTSVKSVYNNENGSVSTWKVTVGASYTFKVSNDDDLTVGATFTPGHKSGTIEYERISQTSTSVTDTLKPYPTSNLEIPTQIGVGVAYNRGNRLRLALDYTLHHWGSLKYPRFSNTALAYDETDLYSDRHKINFGAEFCQNEYARSFVNRVRWRMGVGYATPYTKINGYNGPSEFSASFGVGLPIINTYNNRSVLNIGVQYVRTSAKELIKENTFRLNLSFTFNERWFAKWKFE